MSVTGSYVGTNGAGTAPLGNRLDGITASGGGGAYAGSNVISGNGRDGVRISDFVGDDSAPNLGSVGSNRIGLAASGSATIPNGGNGITLIRCRNLGIGFRASPGFPTSMPASNRIAGNPGDGVYIEGDPAQAVPARLSVYNTRIGRGDSVDSTAAHGNGGSGIHLRGARGVSITFTTIGGNARDGITVADGNGMPSREIQITDNNIGGDRRTDYTIAFGNLGNGVAVINSSDNKITGNDIAYNGGSGVSVSRTGTIPAERNQITSNSIYENAGLGIDLVSAGEGVTPNDPGDADAGPNRLQNFPLITSFSYGELPLQAPRTSTATVRLNSEPNRQFLISLYESALADPTGHGEGERLVTSGIVNTDAAGNAEIVLTATDFAVGKVLTATATLLLSPGPLGSTSEFSPAVRVWPSSPTVLAQHVFYNNSAYDGGNPAANASDDDAIATPVGALMPGDMYSARRSFTNYSRGLNGLMVDVADMFPGVTPTADDFEFRIGNNSVPAGWAAAPAPSAINIRRGAGVGGSDRVTITWPDGAIRDTWLQVTVKAGDRTGLSRPHVFYFGNLVGDSDLFWSDLSVTFEDLMRSRVAIGSAPRSMHDNLDVNRDGAITPRDYALVRANLGRRLVNLQPPAALAPSALASLGSARVWDEEPPDVLPR